MADVAAVQHLKTSQRRTRARSAYLSPRPAAAIAALGLSALLLFAMGILISATQATQRSRFAWIQHTDDVLLQVAGIQLNVMRMESKIRAYALSNDRRHVDDWPPLKADTEARLAKLGALVADNPTQARRLSLLRPKIDERIAAWTRFTDLNMNAVPIQQLRNDLAGDVLNRPMRSINAEFSAFRSVEQGLLRGRQSEAGAHAAFLTTLAFLLALTAPAVGAAGLYVLVRERNRLRDRELQIQFEHSQRLSLMGETASMLAHEISQPLAAAKNYLSVLKHGFAASVTAPQAEIAQKVDDQLVRASGILQRLRNFIEKRTDEREAESPATLVADAVALLGTMHNQCALHTDIEKDLPKVLVDRVQIQQVLVNLMRNAIEAMANAACQELWLSVARAPNNMTLFQLRDCGPGISPQVRDRLFQPFASTKQGGMGVGLSICKRIIQDHGGEIRADTAPRGGAVFCFTLPVA